LFTRSDTARLKQDLLLKAKLMNVDLQLNTRWGVFSPRVIDDGTELLMKHITVDSDDICLDLGCGYGPIGLAIAKHCDKGEVHMVDKDFVAVELANQNAKLNNIGNAKAYLSDAFRQVSKEVKFDQIISNIPAKVGREQLSIILYDAFDALKPGGKITVVTINGLRDFIKSNFKFVFGNYKKIKQGQKYVVSQAMKNID
jgi:16S rRNA G1207 methylase RsmC